MAGKEFNEKEWQQIIIKAWKDPKEKERLLKDPDKATICL